MKSKKLFTKLTAWVLTLLMLISISPTTFMSDFDDDTEVGSGSAVTIGDVSPGAGDDPAETGDSDTASEPGADNDNDEDEDTGLADTDSSAPADPADDDKLSGSSDSAGDTSPPDDETYKDDTGTAGPADPTDIAETFPERDVPAVQPDEDEPTEPRNPTEPEEEPSELEESEDFVIAGTGPQSDEPGLPGYVNADDIDAGYDDTDEEYEEYEEFEEEPEEPDEEPELIVITETETIITDFDELKPLEILLGTDENDIPFPTSVEATLEVIETVKTVEIIEVDESEGENLEIVIDEYEQVIDGYKAPVGIDDWKLLGKLEYNEEQGDYMLIPGEYSFEEEEGMYRFESLMMSFDDVADDIAPGVMSPILDIIMFASTDTIIDVSDITKTAGNGWTYSGGTNGTYTIAATTEYPIPNITITGDNGTSDRNVEVAAGTKAEITLNNTTITIDEFERRAALFLHNNSTVTITLASGTTNTLTSGENHAGLQLVESGGVANLTIMGTGILNVTGGSSGAGIGGGDVCSSGTITINLGVGGIINAVGGDSAAGIGGGPYGGFDEDITILHGRINAIGGSSSTMGIGRGLGASGSGKIILSGGYINASSIGGGADSPFILDGNAVVYSANRNLNIKARGVGATDSRISNGIIGFGSTGSPNANFSEAVAETYLMFGSSVTPTDDFDIRTDHAFKFNGTLNLNNVKMFNGRTPTTWNSVTNTWNTTTGEADIEITSSTGGITLSGTAELTNYGTIKTIGNVTMSGTSKLNNQTTGTIEVDYPAIMTVGAGTTLTNFGPDVYNAAGSLESGGAIFINQNSPSQKAQLIHHGLIINQNPVLALDYPPPGPPTGSMYDNELTPPASKPGFGIINEGNYVEAFSAPIGNFSPRRSPLDDTSYNIPAANTMYKAGSLHPVYDVPGVGTREQPTNVIDLSKAPSLPFGFGWTYSDGVYIIDGTYDPVVVINSNTGTGHRLTVASGVTAHIILDNDRTGASGPVVATNNGTNNPALLIGDGSDVTITIKGGTSTLLGSGQPAIDGGASVTIRSDGNSIANTINVGATTGSPTNINGIRSGTVNIQSGTVDARGTVSGISATTLVNITGGKITATGGANGITAPTVTIEGTASVTPDVSAAGSSNGINATIAVNIINSVVKAVRNPLSSNSGITAPAVTISNSYVLAEGDSSGIAATASLGITNDSAVFVSHPLTGNALSTGTKTGGILVVKSNSSTTWYGDSVTAPIGTTVPDGYTLTVHRGVYSSSAGKVLNITRELVNYGSIVFDNIPVTDGASTSPDHRPMIVVDVAAGGAVTEKDIKGAAANTPAEDERGGDTLKVKAPLSPLPPLRARAFNNTTSQVVEYGISTTNSITGIQTATINTTGEFTGLKPNTQYYIFARSKETDNFSAGDWSAPLPLETLGWGLTVSSTDSAETLTGISSYTWPDDDADYTPSVLAVTFSIEATAGMPVYLDDVCLAAGTSSAFVIISWNGSPIKPSFPYELVPGTPLNVVIQPVAGLTSKSTPYTDTLKITTDFEADPDPLAGEEEYDIPVDISLSFKVELAPGAPVTAPVIITASTTETKITISRSLSDPLHPTSATILTNGQSVEYYIAKSGTAPPSGGWIEFTGDTYTFDNLEPGETYVVYARSAELSDRYNAGTPSSVSEITHYYDAALASITKPNSYSYDVTNSTYVFEGMAYNGTPPAEIFKFTNPNTKPGGSQAYYITDIHILKGNNDEINFNVSASPAGVPVTPPGTGSPYSIAVDGEIEITVSPKTGLPRSENPYTGTLVIITSVTKTDGYTKSIRFEVPLSVVVDRAEGSLVTLCSPFIGAITETSIGVIEGTTLVTATGQDIEYAIAYESVPGSGNFDMFKTWNGGSPWIDEETFFKAIEAGGYGGKFIGLESNTGYMIYARSAQNENYLAGDYIDSSGVLISGETARTLYYNASLKRPGDTGDGYSYALNANNTFTFSSMTYDTSPPSQDFILENTGYEDISVTGISVNSAGFEVTAEIVEDTPPDTPIDLSTGLPVTGFSTNDKIRITVEPDAGLNVGVHTCVLTVATNVHPDIGAGKIIVFNVTISITVTPADGEDVDPPVILTDKTTETSITITHSPTAPLGNGQDIEYAISTSAVPPAASTAWVTIPYTPPAPADETHTFTGLTAGQTYYLFARAKQGGNYNTGAAAYDTEATRSYNATLTGPGGMPSYPFTSSSNEYVFPDMTYNAATGSYTFTLTNTGSHSFNITGAAITSGGTRFTVDSPADVSDLSPIPVNTSGTQNITVSPVSGLSTGTHTAVLQIKTDVGDTAGNKSIVFTVTLKITVTRAAGDTVSAPVITGVTGNSIRIEPPLTMPVNGEQVVEYAISTASSAPSSGWVTMTGTSHTFTGLPEYTTHYVFARARQSNNYSTGASAYDSIMTLDKTRPTATVSYNRTGAADQTPGNITSFARFYKDSVTVTVNAADVLPSSPAGASMSGISKIEWAWSPVHIADLSDAGLDGLSWNDITSDPSFTLTAGKYYVYLRITDDAAVTLPAGVTIPPGTAAENSANYRYLGTGGIVVYNDGTQSTIDMEYYKSPVAEGNSAFVNLNGNTVDKIEITVKGVTTPVPATAYTVDETTGEITFTPSFLDSFSVTGYDTDTFTIYYRPQGEVFNSQTEGNDAPAISTMTLNIIGIDPSLDDLDFPADGWKRVYSGLAHSITVTGQPFADGLGEITVKYNGSVTPPVDAGIYAITADIATGFNYNAAYDLDLGVSLIINPKAISVRSFAVAAKNYNATVTVARSDISVFFDGLVNSESFTYGTDYTVSAVYDSPDAGNQAITGTVNLNRNAANNTARNYIFTGDDDSTVSVSATGIINALPLSIGGFKSIVKPYDGLSRIDISGGLGELYFTGFYGSESASVDLTGIISASFDDEYIGSDKPITFTGQFAFGDAPEGTKLSNYILTQPELTGHIIPGFIPVNGVHYTTTGDNGIWITEAFEIEAMPGYLLSYSDTDAGPWVDVLVSEETGRGRGVIFYVRNKATLEISQVAFEEYMLDNQAPEAFVSYNAKIVNQFLNIITFGITFDQVTTVHIWAQDDLSGVASIEYHRTNTPIPFDDEFSVITDFDDINWVNKDRFVIQRNYTLLLYVRVTDNAGNQAIMYDGTVWVSGIRPPPERSERISQEPIPIAEPPEFPSGPEEPEETPEPTVPGDEGGFPVVPPPEPPVNPGLDDLGEVVGSSINIWWWFFSAFLFLLVLILFLFLILWKRRRDEEDDGKDSGGASPQPVPQQEERATG